MFSKPLPIARNGSRNMYNSMAFLKHSNLFLGSLIILIYVMGHVEGSGCDKEGPCGVDRFCSPTQNRCRPCKDVVGQCKNRTEILERFKDCDAFCFKNALEDNEMKQKQTQERLAEVLLERDRLNDTVTRLEREAGTKDVDWRLWLFIGLFAFALTLLIVACLVILYVILLRKKGPASGSNQSELQQLLAKNPMMGHTQATAPPAEDGYVTGSSNSPQDTPPEQRHAHRTDSDDHIHTEETQQDNSGPQFALP